MAVVPRSLRFTLFGVLAGLCTCGVALAAGTTLYSFLLRSHEQPGFTIEKGSRITLKTASAYVK